MIKPWLFEFFHAEHDAAKLNDPAIVQKRFQDYIDLWVLDEKLGLEGIFFSEHHFGPGYSPSANLVLAHVAALTSKMRLGVLGTVTGYATPWRVAEEFAMLDHFTKGRLEIGIVSGIPPELGVVGIDLAKAHEVHAETIDVLLAAIENPDVKHEGKNYKFDVRITPRFYQSAPNVWTASTKPDSARKAGERGLKMCTAFADSEVLAGVVAAYHEGAKAAGRKTSPDDVAIRRAMMIAEDEAHVAEAGETFKQNNKEFWRFTMQALKIPDAGHGQAGSKDELIVGTAEQVADEIIRQCRVSGVGNFLGMFNVFETGALKRQHELFGKHVVPRLRAANVG